MATQEMISFSLAAGDGARDTACGVCDRGFEASLICAGPDHDHRSWSGNKFDERDISASHGAMK